jgi:hypothetical protein
MAAVLKSLSDQFFVRCRCCDDMYRLRPAAIETCGRGDNLGRQAELGRQPHRLFLIQVTNGDDLRALYPAQRSKMQPRSRAGTNEADPMDRTGQSRTRSSQAIKMNIQLPFRSEKMTAIGEGRRPAPRDRIADRGSLDCFRA